MLVLQVSDDVAAELEADLTTAGIEHARHQAFSATSDLVIVGIVAFTEAGGIQQLAALLDALLQRHSNKQFKVTSTTRTEFDGVSRTTTDELDATGYSHAALERILRTQAELQRIADENWNRMLRGDSGE